jgi:hypothetical protein
MSSENVSLRLEDIERVVDDEDYYLFANTMVMVCLLTLKNGHKVLGKCLWISEDNFDEENCKKIAKSNAIDKVWQLEGYLLRERMNSLTNAQAAFDALKDSLRLK